MGTCCTCCACCYSQRQRERIAALRQYQKMRRNLRDVIERIRQDGPSQEAETSIRHMAAQIRAYARRLDELGFPLREVEEDMLNMLI